MGTHGKPGFGMSFPTETPKVRSPCLAKVPALTWTVMAAGPAVGRWWIKRKVRTLGKKFKAKDGKMVKGTEGLSKRRLQYLCVLPGAWGRREVHLRALHTVWELLLTAASQLLEFIHCHLSLFCPSYPGRCHKSN